MLWPIAELGETDSSSLKELKILVAGTFELGLDSGGFWTRMELEGSDKKEDDISAGDLKEEAVVIGEMGLPSKVVVVFVDSFKVTGSGPDKVIVTVPVIRVVV